MIVIPRNTEKHILVFLSNKFKVIYRLAIDEFADIDSKVESKEVRDVTNSADNSILKNIDKVGISRIEYLHNKFGKFSSEDLNHRINLRGALLEEIERINNLGLSKREIGPAVAGTLDKTTGKYYFGINNLKGKTPQLIHSEINNRIKNMPIEIKDGYTFTYGSGSHAEVYSLNQALLANPSAKPTDLITHVVRSGKKLKPAGMMMPRCSYCEFITKGYHFSSEVSIIGE